MCVRRCDVSRHITTAPLPLMRCYINHGSCVIVCLVVAPAVATPYGVVGQLITFLRVIRSFLQLVAVLLCVRRRSLCNAMSSHVFIAAESHTTLRCHHVDFAGAWGDLIVELCRYVRLLYQSVSYVNIRLALPSRYRMTSSDTTCPPCFRRKISLNGQRHSRMRLRSNRIGRRV